VLSQSDNKNTHRHKPTPKRMTSLLSLFWGTFSRWTRVSRFYWRWGWWRWWWQLER